MKQLQLIDLLSRGRENTLRRENPWWQGDPLVDLPKLRRWAFEPPYLTEDELRARGAIYKKADKPWAPFAIQDGRLITGQNPASGGAVADLVIAELKG